MNGAGWVARHWPILAGGVAAAVAWGTLQAQVGEHDKQIVKIEGVIVDQAVAAEQIRDIKLDIGRLSEDLDDATAATDAKLAEILRAVREAGRDDPR